MRNRAEARGDEPQPQNTDQTPMKDPLSIHLSLVSHTNIGKTTLARTLLMRDVGEVADRAHVTEAAADYVLARDSDGSSLILWDTPGFGNSVQLAKRLEGRSNPIGWFLSSVWDRFADKSLWLNQRAVRHIRDTSNVVLYLVNVFERPETSPYVPAEMKVLSWIQKPVIVLLNQMGPRQDPDQEAREIEAWNRSLAPYDFVKRVLPMDAFARCWVQESSLFDAIGSALPEAQQPTFASLQSVWLRGRRAIYASSIEAMAAHLRLLMNAQAKIPEQTIKDRALSLAKQLGLKKNVRDPLADAQTELSSQAADSFCALTSKLIEINGLRGKGVSKEIIRRMKSDWHLAPRSLAPASAAAIGTGLGAASGAAAGLAADAASGGLTMGLGTLLGGLIGAVGGLSAAAAYSIKTDKKETELSWSNKAICGFMLEALLLYLAVAHFGRGRGEWTDSESPAIWKDAAKNALENNPPALSDWRKLDADDLQNRLTDTLDRKMRSIFQSLYGASI